MGPPEVENKGTVIEAAVWGRAWEREINQGGMLPLRLDSRGPYACRSHRLLPLARRNPYGFSPHAGMHAADRRAGAHLASPVGARSRRRVSELAQRDVPGTAIGATTPAHCPGLGAILGLRLREFLAESFTDSDGLCCALAMLMRKPEGVVGHRQ